MTFYNYLNTRHCRWCGIAYESSKPVGMDGFCGAAHKQAHYRAYKKYVTATSDQARSIRRRRLDIR